MIAAIILPLFYAATERREKKNQKRAKEKEKC